MHNKSVNIISLLCKPYTKVFGASNGLLCFIVVLPINRSTLGCLFSQCLAFCCQDTCSTIADNSLNRRRYGIRQQLTSQKLFVTNQQKALRNSTVMGLIQTRFKKERYRKRICDKGNCILAFLNNKLEYKQPKIYTMDILRGHLGKFIFSRMVGLKKGAITKRSTFSNRTICKFYGCNF